ncbi:hypothetical protein QBK99_21890 [Corticibacterium sp. UT-5YL-CI-8]|nr:hypothetical protein [Tianweitania sp. UT-5YL-CI-8]
MAERERFEAGLFLEINSNQASAGSDIIQAIWTVLDPFRAISVARLVVNSLAETTPLKGHLARSSVDAGRIKTASIVSFGLQPITKRSGEDSLFYLWNDTDAKSRFQAGQKNDADLQAYLDFSVHNISAFLNGVKVAIGSNKWRIAVKDGPGVLSVTTINGLIILMRKLIATGQITIADPVPDFSPLSTFDFNSYKSSQYADMATHMAKLIK